MQGILNFQQMAIYYIAKTIIIFAWIFSGSFYRVRFQWKFKELLEHCIEDLT